MKNLFLVSVAIGIFSGTTLTVNAQSSVNIEQVNNSAVQKKPARFVEGIEIKGAASVTEKAAKPNTVTGVSIPAENTEVTSIENFTSLQFKYAQLLDVDVESVSNMILFTEIEKWWGTHYRYGGATKDGIDCSAYTGTLVHSVYGITLPRTSRDQYESTIKLDKEEIQQGDLVFFKSGRGVSHIGLYLGNGYFTHSSTSVGVTISNLCETYWSKKFIGGGRITIAPVTE